MTTTDKAKQRIEAWVRSLGTNGQAPTLLDMAVLLESEARVHKENAALKAALKRARALAIRPSACGFTMRQFATHIGITPTQLSEWTSEKPTSEPDFVD